MGKISNYARVLVAKLQDVFVVDQTDNNVTTTKSVTVEQIGNAICGEQVHADLETDDQTIIGGINENKDKVGDLSSLTTTNKDSLVDAVNEVNGKFKTFAFSGTTNSHGNLSLTGVASTVIAVGANCTSSSVYVTIGKNSTGSRIMLCFRSVDTDEQIINTAVEGTMLYYDI